MASTTEGVDDPNRSQRGSQSRPETSYRDYRDRYRDMAKTLESDGHIAWAEAMPLRRASTMARPRCLETEDIRESRKSVAVCWVEVGLV